jgi:hypothetical protein
MIGATRSGYSGRSLSSTVSPESAAQSGALAELSWDVRHAAHRHPVTGRLAGFR